MEVKEAKVQAMKDFEYQQPGRPCKGAQELLNGRTAYYTVGWDVVTFCVHIEFVECSLKIGLHAGTVRVWWCSSRFWARQGG